MLNGIPLHKAGYKGKGMTIAVFDGGFMNVDSIPAFKNVNIIATRDFVYPPSDCIYEELDHGTEVLSTMAINEPDIFIGTAPEADYILIRTEDGRTESMAEEDFWVAAAEYADSIGADVINSSLGYHGFDKDLGSHQYRDLDGRQAICSRSASMLASKGMILTNSAGNEGNNTWKKINCPSDASDILTVGALTAKRINTLFSSVGPSADGRVKPDVMSLGAHAAVISGAGKHTYANGTSFASPITCGMVACLWQALPQKTALEIMDLIRSSSDRFDYPDNVFGYGIPDFWKALQLGR
jgi:subtilisin family serine protease